MKYQRGVSTVELLSVLAFILVLIGSVTVMAKIHTDNKETLINALARIKDLEVELLAKTNELNAVNSKYLTSIHVALCDLGVPSGDLTSRLKFFAELLTTHTLMPTTR